MQTQNQPNHEALSIIRRHRRQIAGRDLATASAMAEAWTLTFRPGDQSGNFVNKRFRPAEGVVSVSLCSRVTRTRDGKPREQLLLLGHRTGINPETAQAVFGGEFANTCLFDLGLSPRIGGGGFIIDPAKNPSMALLGLESDAVRQNYWRKGYTPRATPVLPQLWLGFRQENLPDMVDSPALRQRAALSTQRPVEAVHAMEASDRLMLLAKEWEAAVLYPGAPGNNTGLFLIPGALLQRVPRDARLFLDFEELVGVELFNPAKLWHKPRLARNPAWAVAARFDMLPEDVVGGHYDMPDDLAIEIEKEFLVQMGGRAPLCTMDTVIRAFEQPEAPLELHAAPELTDAQAIRLMRADLGRHSEAVTDEDCLTAARHPHRPLWASGLCATQVIAGNPLISGDTHDYFGQVRRQWRNAAGL